MAEQKPGSNEVEEWGADPETLDALLRQEATDRLTAAAGDAALQPPDDDTLFDYLSGRLDEAAEDAVRDWLVADADVARRLEDLQDWMTEASPAAGNWETRLAWKDLQERLSRDEAIGRVASTTGWIQGAVAGLAAALLLMVGGGIGWWWGSSPGVDDARGVHAVTLQLLRDGGQVLPAGRELAVSMPLNVSQGSCETLQWVLWRGGVEVRRLTLTPQAGHLHVYLSLLEPGAYRIDIEDCHGGRQSLEIEARE